jgi:hypothetical protein
MRNPKKTMLDYSKIILKSVHFSPKLFKKEYRKSFQYLNPLEVVELKQWWRNERTSIEA